MSQFKYSVIVPHYDQSISDDLFCRGIQCLLDQTFQDFEVLIYHDGPTSRPIPEIWKSFGSRSNLTITKSRENNWGHGNRDKGIKASKGEYIVHFNPDNILYSDALEEITKESQKTYNLVPTTNKIIVFPILMRGMQSNGKLVWRDVYNAKDNYMIFTGYPTYKYNVDAMQLVMSSNLWDKYNGWYDKSKESDGNMYPKFVSDHGARYCSKILGEHW